MHLNIWLKLSNFLVLLHKSFKTINEPEKVSRCDIYFYENE